MRKGCELLPGFANTFRKPEFEFLRKWMYSGCNLFLGKRNHFKLVVHFWHLYINRILTIFQNFNFHIHFLSMQQLKSLAFLHTSKALKIISITGLSGTVAGCFGSFDDLDVHIYPQRNFESLMCIMKQHLHYVIK